MVLVVMAAGLGIGLWVWKQVRSVRPTNLILITVDTLRADHLGAYGYRRATSPNVDALAKESLLFRRAFSQAPETNPSLSSLMTSHYVHETQVRRNFHQLQPGANTLAEILQANGWRTGAVVSNYSLRRGSGFEQGFEDYDDRMEDVATPTWEGIERVAPKTTAAALDWLRRHREDRFFLWVHYMDPHAPYHPLEPYNAMFLESAGGERKHLPFLSLESFEAGSQVGGIPVNARLGDHADPEYYVSQYDGEISFLDHWLGELLKETRALGLLDNTLVILTADHGEGMGEHNLYFNHTEFVYTELIHVPLLIRLPGASQAGKAIELPVGLIDLLPTILRALALESPGPLRGQNLLNPQPKAILAGAFFTPGQVTVISGEMKLIHTAGRYSLYDLGRDFYEARDLMQTGDVAELDAARGLKETMFAIRNQDELGLGLPVEWVVLPEEKRKLKALGYVQ